MGSPALFFTVKKGQWRPPPSDHHQLCQNSRVSSPVSGAGHLYHRGENQSRCHLTGSQITQYSPFNNIIKSLDNDNQFSLSADISLHKKYGIFHIADWTPFFFKWRLLLSKRLLWVSCILWEAAIDHVLRWSHCPQGYDDTIQLQRLLMFCLLMCMIRHDVWVSVSVVTTLTNSFLPRDSETMTHNYVCFMNIINSRFYFPSCNQ